MKGLPLSNIRALCVLTCLLLPVLTWSESFLDLVQEADVATVQAAIDAGANLEVRNEDGRTPLMLAAWYNENAVVQVLLDAGADLEARDTEYGNTPLMFAARHNENAEVVQVLLDAGADATATNEDGENAWDLIQENDALEGTPAYWALNDLRFR